MKKRVMLAIGMMAAMVGAPVVRAQQMVTVGMQVKDDLFAGTDKFKAGATDVTEINMDPTMLGMVGGGNANEAAVAKHLNFIVIHAYKYDKPGMYNLAEAQAFAKKLEDGSWNCFMHVVDSKKGESTDMCSRQDADKSNEMMMVAIEPTGLTFMHIKGQASLADLQKLKMLGDMNGAKTIEKGKVKGLKGPERPERPEAPEKPEAPEQ